MTLLIRQNEDDNLANAIVVADGVLPQTISNLPPGIYQIGRLVWSNPVEVQSGTPSINLTSAPSLDRLTGIAVTQTIPQLLQLVNEGRAESTSGSNVSITKEFLSQGQVVTNLTLGMVIDQLRVQYRSPNAQMIERLISISSNIGTVKDEITITYDNPPTIGALGNIFESETSTEILNLLNEGSAIRNDGGPVAISKQLLVNGQIFTGSVQIGDVITGARFTATGGGATAIVENLSLDITVQEIFIPVPTIEYSPLPSLNGLNKIVEGSTVTSIVNAINAGIATRSDGGPVNINSSVIVNNQASTSSVEAGDVVNEIVFTATGGESQPVVATLVLNITVESLRDVIQLTTNPSSEGLSIITDGESKEDIIARLSQKGVTNINTDVDIEFFSGNSLLTQFVENQNIDRIRFTYTHENADDLVYDVIVDITVSPIPEVVPVITVISEPSSTNIGTLTENENTADVLGRLTNLGQAQLDDGTNVPAVTKLLVGGVNGSEVSGLLVANTEISHIRFEYIHPNATTRVRHVSVNLVVQEIQINNTPPEFTGSVLTTLGNTEPVPTPDAPIFTGTILTQE